VSFNLYLTYLALSFLRPIDLFWPDLAALHLMAVLLVAALITALINVRQTRAFASHGTNLTLLILFLVTIGLSAVSNNMGIDKVYASLSDFSVSALFFILTALNLTSLAKLRKTCTVLVLCLSVQAALGISAYQNGMLSDQLLVKQNTDVERNYNATDDPKTPFEDVDGVILWRIRSLGFLNDPNDFGQAMVMVLPLVYLFYRPRKLLCNFAFCGLFAGSLIYGIQLTHSRGAVVGCLVMIGMALHKRIGTLRMGIVLLIAAATLGSLQIGGRSISSHEESASGRVDAWWAGIQMAKHQPLLGVGFGNFTDHHELTAHNSFVLCFAELGFTGYFLWIAMLVICYRGLAEAIRLAEPESNARKMAQLLQYSFVGYMTCAAFLSRTYEPGLFLLMALCASVTWNIRQEHCKRLSNSVLAPTKWFTATLATMAITFGGIYIMVVMNPA
jgi:hypothetical protein